MNILDKLNQISSAIEYTSATLSYPNDVAAKGDKTVAVHKGRSFSSENQLNKANKNLQEITPMIAEMISIVNGLSEVGAEGQQVLPELIALHKRCCDLLNAKSDAE